MFDGTKTSIPHSSMLDLTTGKPETLEWVEYVAVVTTLVVSMIVCVWSHKSAKNSKGFLLGENMPLAYIAMSLVASSTSGVSLLGKPAETYTYGIEFFVMNLFTSTVIAILTHVIFLPVMMKLNSPSLYEYFDLRFNNHVRKLATLNFILTKTCYTGLAILPPSIVIHQFSGWGMNEIIIVITFITTLYTVVGGFKGVVWADTMQGAVMFLSMIILCTISTLRMGGVSEIFRVANESGRLKVTPATWDPTQRVSLWGYTLFINGITSVSVNQMAYQRFKSVSSEKKAIILSWLQYAGMMFFGHASMFTGLSVYALYYGCDPKSAKIVDSYNNVIVYWINDIGKHIRGIRGVYIAGITCASISTVSTNINSIAGLIYTEISTFLQHETRRPAQHIRALSGIVGFTTAVIAIFARNSGSLLELAYSFVCFDGIIAGFFILGVLVVPANTKGAISGGLCALVLTLATIIGSSFYKEDLPKYSVKVMRTDLCPFNVTSDSSLTPMSSTNVENIFPLFRISPFSYGILALLVTVTVGVIVSLLWPEKYLRDPNLYCRFVHKHYSGRYSAVPASDAQDATALALTDPVKLTE